MAKKTVAAKSAKKVAAPKPTKAAKPAKKEKGVILAEAKLKFVSFSVRAVIPTQQYGNIQPEIVVEAPTYEEARAFVMPLIEDLYKHYGESKPGFLGKVVETEKVVTPAPVTPSVANPEAQIAPKTTAQDVPAPEATAGSAEKPQPVLNAEKAIRLAMSADAATIIQDQIEKSTKIPQEYKDGLITLVLKKRGEFK